MNNLQSGAPKNEGVKVKQESYLRSAKGEKFQFYFPFMLGKWSVVTNYIKLPKVCISKELNRENLYFKSQNKI